MSLKTNEMKSKGAIRQMNLLCTALLGMLLIPCAALAGAPDVDVYGKIVEVKPGRVENGFRLPAERVRMIDVQGKTITMREFLKTYCLGDKGTTCTKARKIYQLDSGSGPQDLPRGE